MARIRTIKPEFFTSEDIVELTPLARLFYVSLWCEADREGRLIWKPRTLKLRYFPADDCDIEAISEELVSKGLIVLYRVDGKDYCLIPSFAKHQVINNRESESILPPPENPRVHDACTRVTGEGKGREGKGREGAPSSRKQAKTQMPKDFTVSERVKKWAEEKGHTRLEEHFESFKAKCAAKAYQYVDWDAAFMEAIRENWAKLPVSAPTSGPQRPHAPVWQRRSN